MKDVFRNLPRWVAFRSAGRRLSVFVLAVCAVWAVPVGGGVAGEAPPPAPEMEWEVSTVPDMVTPGNFGTRDPSSTAIAIPGDSRFPVPAGAKPLLDGGFLLPPVNGDALTPATPVVTLPPQPDPFFRPPLALPLGPPGGVSRAPNPEEIRMEAEANDVAHQERVKQAEAFLKIARWDETIRLCDLILADRPDHTRAHELRERARDARAANEIRTARRQFGDAASDAFTQSYREAIPRMPAPGPIRPDLFEKDIVPLFPENADQQEAIASLLRQRVKSINFIKADPAFVLASLHELADVNLIYNDEDVEGKSPITLQGRNLTLKALLDLFCARTQLGYTVKEGIVTIFAEGQSDAARFMPLRVVALEHGNTRRSTLGGDGGGGDDDDGGNADIDIYELMTWVENELPNWPAEGRWRFDRKFNRVYIWAPPAVADDVEVLIRTIDQPPIQVQIATHFVSVDEQTLRGLGIDWSVQPHPMEVPGYTRPNFDYGNVTGRPDNTDTDTDNDTALDGLDRWIPKPSNHLGFGTAGAAMALAGSDVTAGLSTIISGRRLEAILTMINNDINSEVVTRPFTLALNHETALINLTDTYPYPTDWEAISSGMTNSYSTTQNLTLVPSNWEEKELGTKLEVSPSVGRDLKTIVLRVKPEITMHQRNVSYPVPVSTSGASGTTNTNTTTTQMVERPVFSTNTITAQAVVEDGYTLIVGGLFRDNISDSVRKIPGLSRIPILGKMLFTSTNKDSRRYCMLIFVTAKIVTPRNETYTDSPFEAERNQRATDFLRRHPPTPRTIDELLGGKPVTPWFRTTR